MFDGVLVSNSSGNIIGPYNLIRSNGATGIGISKQAFGIGNLVSENSILGNVGLAIDLGVDGVTLNDLR